MSYKLIFNKLQSIAFIQYMLLTYRYVISTASLVRDNAEDIEDRNVKFVLSQIAEKDVACNYDGEVIFEASDDNESLTMTTTIKTPNGNVSGTIDFSWYDLDSLDYKGGVISRRASFSISRNQSRRNSDNISLDRSRRNSMINLPLGGVDPKNLLSSMMTKFGDKLSMPRDSSHNFTAPKPEIEISHHE